MNQFANHLMIQISTAPAEGKQHSCEHGADARSMA
jgi:hypothetical protein